MKMPRSDDLVYGVGRLITPFKEIKLNLMIYGLSMSVFGAIVCYVFFGLLMR
jgi:hypothetical protein